MTGLQSSSYGGQSVRRYGVSICCGLAALLCPVFGIRADTWDNSTNNGGAWSTNNNWADNTEPTSADPVIFPTPIPFGDPTIALSSLSGGEHAASITFNDSYSLGANVLTLHGAGGNITVASGKTVTITSGINGTVGLSKGGTGTLILSGATDNLFTGPVQITGVLSITENAKLGNAANTVLIGPGVTTGTLQVTSTFSTSRQISPGILGGAISVDSLRTFTISGSLGGLTNPLTFNGAGTASLTASSTRSGLTHIQNGTVRLLNGAALGTGGSLVSNNGRLEISAGINHFNVISLQSLGGLRSGGAGAAHSGTISVQASGSEVYLSGGDTVSGTLQLGGPGSNQYTGGTGAKTIVNGLGRVTILTASNDYVGDWQIDSGILRPAGGLSLGIGTSPIVVNDTGTLQLWSVTFDRAITLNNGGTLAFESGGQTYGTHTIAPGAAVTFAFKGAAPFGEILGDAPNDLTGGSGGAGIALTSDTAGNVLTLDHANDYAGGWSIDNCTLRFTHPDSPGSGTTPIGVNAGGALQPVALTFNRDVSLNNGAAMAFENGGQSLGKHTIGTSDAVTFALKGTGDQVLGDAPDELSGGSGSTLTVTSEIAGNRLILNHANDYIGGWSITNLATVRIADPSALGTGSTAVALSNDGTLDLAGVTLNRPLALNDDAQLTGSSGAAFSNGIASLTPGASVTFSAAAPNDVLTIGNSANDLTGGGMSSQIRVEGAGTVVLPHANSYTGRWFLASGLLLVTNTSGSATGTGGQGVTVLTGGALGGNGRIGESVSNSGAVHPGGTAVSPLTGAGTLSLQSNYSQSATGSLNIEIGGITAGTQHDRVAVTGSASLAGTLNISILNSFEPQIGQSFVILTCGARSGTFSQVTGTSAGPGKFFRVQYNPNDVTLTVEPPANEWGISIGVRETGSSGAIGSDGGTTGDIEWIDLDGQSITADDTWHEYTWHFGTAAVTAFTGDGILSAPNNKGVLEHIRIRNTGGNIGGEIRLRIDDIVNTTNLDTVPVPTLITGFEGFSTGVNDTFMFREPVFSPGTLPFMGPGGNATLISTASAHTGSRSLAARWTFVPNGSTEQWLRLTTNGAPVLPNPVIDISPNSSLSIWLRASVYNPTGNRAVGLDVSEFQGAGIDWERVARPASEGGGGKQFAFIRATRGGTTITPSAGDLINTGARRLDDATWAYNIVHAKAAGMLVGPYHFGRPDLWTTDPTGTIDDPATRATPEDDARHYLEIAGQYMKPGYLRPVYDLETDVVGSSNTQLTSYVSRFIEHLIRYKGPSAACIIYAGGNFTSQVNPPLNEYPLWYPNFFVESQWADGNPNTQIYGIWDDLGDPQPWKFWQYESPDVYIPGINTPSGLTHNDADVAHGDINFVRQFQVQGAIWTGAAGNQWAANGNWDTGATPTGSTEVLFDVGIPLTGPTILLAPGQSAGGIYFGDNYTLSGGTVTLSDGRIDVDDTRTGEINSAGVLAPAGFRKVGRGALLQSAVTVSVTGLAEIVQGTMTVSGGSLDVNGDLAVDPELTQRDQDTRDDAANGLIPVTVGEITSSTLNITAGAAVTASAAYVGGAASAPGAIGTLNLSDNASLTLPGVLKIWNSAVPLVDSRANLSGGLLSIGVLDTDGDPAGLNWTGGTLHVVTCNSDLTNQGGTLAPGTSAGSTTINGTYIQQPGGTLEIEIGGTSQGSHFDHVAVSGAATLDGTLQIQLVNGFEPQPTDSFVILTFSSRTGEFSHVAGMNAGVGQVFSVQYNPGNVTLIVTAPAAPDLDTDGDVDVDDLTLLGSCHTRDQVPHDGTPLCQEADLDNDGDVDPGDFGIYQRCFRGTNVPADPGCGL